MKKPASVASVIMVAVLALGACERPQPEVTFRKVDPNFGGLQGGKTVRVMGENVRLDIGYAVYFGDLRSPQVSIQNKEALLAVTPQQANPAVVDVTIRADNGQVFVIKRGFEYINQAGNLLETPETTEESETAGKPEVPEEPEVPEKAEMPQTPETSETQQAPETQKTQKTPEASESPY